MNKSPAHPIICDLDESLLRTDTFRDALFHLAIHAPWKIFRKLRCLRFGWAAFKNGIAQEVSMAEIRPPFQDVVIEFLRRERARGRKIILCTATPQRWADEVAGMLPGLFDEVIGSTPDLNLKGRRKASRLLEMFGDRGFEYIGDSLPDLEVWRFASRAIFAGHREMVKRRLREISPDFLDLHRNALMDRIGAEKRGGGGDDIGNGGRKKKK